MGYSTHRQKSNNEALTLFFNTHPGGSCPFLATAAGMLGKGVRYSGNTAPWYLV